MPKGERNVNPAQAQRKADKQKEIAKNRKLQQTQKNDKLARRNPERLQRQIDDLKEIDARGGLRPKDKETLTQLERDVKGIRRAREALGDAAPKFASRDNHNQSHDRGNERRDPRQEQKDRRQFLGKRRRDEQEIQGDDGAGGSDTDPDVRSIPMPRDTPPPIPKQHMQDPQVGPDGQRVPHALPTKMKAPAKAQTVYSSAPQIRDLKKEAVKFMPTVVAQQKKRVQGQGKLLEPEEVERLEKAGYYTSAAAKEGEVEEKKPEKAAKTADEMDLDEEAIRFQREIEMLQGAESGKSGQHGVTMEEVDDEAT